jgi:hypothetical protein
MGTLKGLRSARALLAFLAVVAPAGATGPAQAAEMDIVRFGEQREREAAASTEFVRRLDLKRWQARKLIPILEEAAWLYVEAYDQEVALLPSMIEAFNEFLEEDRLDRGFSPPVERRTAAASKQAKDLHEQLTKDLADLQERASEILRPAQRDFAEGFRPGRPALRPAGYSSRPDPDPLAARRRELHEIGRQKHPQLGKLGKLLLCPAAYAEVCAAARTDQSDALRSAAAVWWDGTEACPGLRRDAMRAEICELRAEINNWNLINGLHLDQDQIRQIVEVYDDAVLETDTAAAWVRSQRALPGEVLPEVERAVEQVLSPGQRQVIRDYKPCLIPPKNLKNPVRVGQANDTSHMERWLARARKLPPKRLPKAANALIDQETKRFGELSDTERWRRKRLLVNIARKAAAMDETTFELEKAGLAERIKREDRAHQLRTEINDITRQRGQPGLVARFMINDRFMDQLKQRAWQLAECAGHEHVDLADGPQAENCDRTCAVK